MYSNSSLNSDIIELVTNFYGIATVLFIIIGLIGNSLIFYILTRPKFLKVSAFRYFLVNDVIDMIGIALVIAWIIQSKINWVTTALFCKIWEYIGYTCYNIYPCINALNSIDRILSIKYARRFSFRKKFKFQAFVVSIIIFILMSYDAIYFYYVNLSPIYVCGFSENYFTAFYVYLSNILLTNLLPFCISMISTSLILHYLINHKKNSRLTKNFKREVSILKSVLAMDIWFYVCYMPFCSINLTNATFGLQQNDNGSVWYWFLIHNFAVLLLVVAATCKLFLLVYSNKLIRKELKSLLCMRQAKKKRVAAINSYKGYTVSIKHRLPKFSVL